MIYTTIAWNKVFAIDGANGDLQWFYDPKVSGANEVPEIACSVTVLLV